MRFHFQLAVLSLLLIPGSASASNHDMQKARVFVTDSQSWQMTGNGGGTNDAHGSHFGGGARPQTAEIIKTFGQRCSQVVINDQREKADYVVVLDHEGGKSILAHDNKIAVFNSDGDAIVSHSTRTLGDSVKDACEAIAKDWPSRASHANKGAAPGQAAQLVEVSDKPASHASQISVSSTPANADIEVDGNFVGSTPSVVEVSPGEHSVVVKKNGYQAWQRKMTVTGGSINVSADLEKQ